MILAEAVYKTAPIVSINQSGLFYGLFECCREIIATGFILFEVEQRVTFDALVALFFN